MDTPSVSVVVPGRNCARTIRDCLTALLAAARESPVKEIIFVDDGSTDDTAAIVSDLPVTYLVGEGRGAGAARNIGWRAARHPLIWFVDADCVAEPDALTPLLGHLDDTQVAGVGGSYGNINEDSLLACLVHEEIVARHARMPRRVNFLATFSVVYRRAVLEELDGFDELFLKGQDAELAWRIAKRGYQLAFDADSRVKHFHPMSWPSYLNTQCQQGYWRVWLHLRHRGHARGDSYSGTIDHLQPPLAVVIALTLPLAVIDRFGTIPLAGLTILACLQVPMTRRLMARTGSVRFAMFAVLSFVRAFWRGAGMTAAMLAV
ncbi:MAG: glycosyltransferase, partial [Planctomycetes bacterium]|nr:glycosyltransferase [Planctomycetota bacterium]